MPEILIESIEEINNNHGYLITMNDLNKNIMCTISSRQLCCENYGCCMKFDSETITRPTMADFIGATYLSVHIKTEKDFLYDGTAIKVTVETNKGSIYLFLYNEHNGHYSHTVYVKTEHYELSEDI